MSIDVQAVSTALAQTLQPLHINVYDYGPKAFVSPAAYFAPESIDYTASFNSDDDEQDDGSFFVRFLVGAQTDSGGQAFLNSLISASGAPALLKADKTLGGIVDSINLTGLRNYGVLQLPDGTVCYSAELTIEVLS